MSHFTSPLQSFLIVCDPATSQPDLLVVSAGEEQEGVLDYHIKAAGAGTALHAAVCMIVSRRSP